jgi:uncharacterized protein YgbK (DUF1537 family)
VIAVVADDFTGAAELAAVGLRYGLNTEVQTEFNADSQARLIVVDTDTRSLPPQEAAAEVENLIIRLRQSRPDWVYKKVDSVLRGPVIAELEAFLTAAGKERALLVPANPSFGRKIRAQHYFVNDRPLDRTDFADDPEYPAASSDVLELLGPSQSFPVCVVSVGNAVPPTGIVIGEASTKDDLTAWAKRCDHLTVPAGAAEFFAALLEAEGLRLSSPEHHKEPLQCRTALFVCAASSSCSREAIERASGRGVHVSTMPPELLQTDGPAGELLQRWTNDTISALEQHSKAMVAINQPIVPKPQLAQNLRSYTAALVESVLNEIAIDELFIEGGATASAIVRHLRWKRFFPCGELAPGLVTMSVHEKPNLYLTTKPGSYPWPDILWPLTTC